MHRVSKQMPFGKPASLGTPFALSGSMINRANTFLLLLATFSFAACAGNPNDFAGDLDESQSDVGSTTTDVPGMCDGALAIPMVTDESWNEAMERARLIALIPANKTSSAIPGLFEAGTFKRNSVVGLGMDIWNDTVDAGDEGQFRYSMANNEDLYPVLTLLKWSDIDGPVRSWDSLVARNFALVGAVFERADATTGWPINETTSRDRVEDVIGERTAMCLAEIFRAPSGEISFGSSFIVDFSE